MARALLLAVSSALLVCLTWADVGNFATADTLDFLAQLASMPEQEQDAYLELAGMMLENEGATTCNIFGGTAACLDIPVNSAFVDTCEAHRDNFKVDCAYYNEAVFDLTTDPAQNLENLLGPSKTDSLKQYCPQCLNNLQSLWCAQALPSCGSFKAHVQKALFPAVLAFKKKQEAGEPVDAAIAAAVPGLLSAMAKTMACKEMCEAVIRTCSCDSDGVKTLGEIITGASKQAGGLGDLTQGLSMDQILLKDVWDQPLCDLFASKDDPDFSGVCDLSIVNSQCSNKDVYCNGINAADKDIVEEMVGVEIAHGILGFLDGPSGIIKQSDTFNQEAHIGGSNDYDYFDYSSWAPSPSTAPPQVEQWKEDVKNVTEINQQYLAPPATAWEISQGATPPTHHSHAGAIVGFVFLALGLMALSAVLGIFGWKKYQEYKERQDSGDYHPLGEGTSPARGLGLT